MTEENWFLLFVHIFHFIIIITIFKCRDYVVTHEQEYKGLTMNSLSLNKVSSI